MDKLSKTRDELIGEMEKLRRHLASIESEMLDGTLDLGPVLNPTQRAQKRAAMGEIVEVAPAFNATLAAGVNRSDGGVCLETEVPLRFSINFARLNGMESVEAELIWYTHDNDGKCRLGFKFLD